MNPGRHGREKSAGPARAEPRFSVILCNCNYGDYVGAAIQSVLDQTFADFELIVVDDGSTDNSRQVIRGFRDPRMSAVFKTNGGQASAFNAGFQRARGTYVAFLDSDDLFAPDKLERIDAAFRRARYAVVQHQLQVIDGAGTMADRRYPSLTLGELDVLPLYFRWRRTSYFSATSGLAAPRHLLARVFPIPGADWRLCADAAISRPLAVFGKVFTLAEPAGYYRIHGRNNWMNTERRAQSLESELKVHAYLNGLLAKWGEPRRVGVPVPRELLARYRIGRVALYGAGRHTEYLLRSAALAPDIEVGTIIDDDPRRASVAGVPVVTPDAYRPRAGEAVLVSSDAVEMEIAKQALARGWNHVLTIYGWRRFAEERADRFAGLADVLRARGHRRIALYGAGYHTLNVLLSGVLTDDLEPVCLLDDKPSARCLLNVPVFAPGASGRPRIDAVVISSDGFEQALYEKALAAGFENVYLLYGARRERLMHLADRDFIARSIDTLGVRSIALYGAGAFTRGLLQDNALQARAAVRCILDRTATASTIQGIPVCRPAAAAARGVEAVVVPPGDGAGDVIRFLRQCGVERIIAVPSNPDEPAMAYDFLRAAVRAPVMLDVGANSGNSLAPFARDGWQVHAFEPDSENRRRLLRRVGHLPNVHVEPRALSDRAGERVPLYRSPVSTGISGLSMFHPSHRLAEYVETLTLREFAAARGIREADFLKVDTEGYDLFVLRGNDWRALRPRVVLCEFEDRKTRPLGYTFHDLARFLVEQGYCVLVSEWYPIAEYGRQQRWRRFADYPCELLDPAAGGNLFAFADPADRGRFADGVIAPFEAQAA